MDLTAVLAGAGAILTTAGGTVLVVREFRRRDHVAANKEIEMLAEDLHTCRKQLLHDDRLLFVMRQRLVDNGIEVPQIPRVDDG